MAQEPTSPNPLSSAPQAGPSAPDPLLVHARLWQHINSMPSHELPAQTDRVNYVLPILGALAGDPKVTSRDVIKAAAQAAADGKVPPSEAVQFISQMPTDQEKLRPWLKQMYTTNLTAAVHLKAAAMKQQQPSPQPVAQSQPVPQPAPQQVPAAQPIPGTPA